MRRCCSVLLFAILASAAWLLPGPGPGLAGAAAMDGMLDKARIEGRLTAEEAAAIASRLEQTGVEGLPQTPFQAKVEEGLAKRVPGKAIIRALDAMRGDYAMTRSILSQDGRQPTPEDIATAADSLRRGLGRRELEELAEAAAAPPSMLATAARTKAYLNTVGFPPALSVEILRKGMESNALTPGWAQLFRVVERTRASGITDRTVTEAAVRTLTGKGSLGDLLQELGFTGRDTRQAPGENAK